MKAIADTGFLVAYLARRDRYHEWAVEVASQTMEPFLTCEAVISEAAFHLGSSSVVLKSIEAGLVEISFSATEDRSALAKLAHQFKEMRPDFADLCLIRMSELYPRHSVITTDRKDFRLYRRFKREAIPLILPPE